ncbi:MAG: type III-B CRISPR module RAMP protein Cmr4, partial [Conexivisphaera sp.]
MSSSSRLAGRLLLAYSLTPVHAGAGRSVGAVDLPVQRDPIGYPVIFSSSFKGALRDNLGARLGHGDKFIKCLFGSDVEEAQKESGRLILTDLYPILYPVANVERGYVYITT